MSDPKQAVLNLCAAFNDLSGLGEKRSGILDFSPDQFGEVLIAVAQSAAKAGTNQLLPAGVSEVAKAVAIDLTGIAVGSVGGLLLRAILVGQESTGKLLEKIRSEPFNTAQRILHEAVTIRPSNEVETNLRRTKLEHAVLELEKAYTLASARKERMLVRLIDGLCELELGAIGFSRNRFKECAVCLDEECDDITKITDSYRAQLNEIRNRNPGAYANADKPISFLHGYFLSLIGNSEADDRGRVIALKRRIGKHELRVAKLRNFSRELRAV